MSVKGLPRKVGVGGDRNAAQFYLQSFAANFWPDVENELLVILEEGRAV